MEQKKKENKKKICYLSSFGSHHSAVSVPRTLRILEERSQDQGQISEKCRCCEFGRGNIPKCMPACAFAKAEG